MLSIVPSGALKSPGPLNVEHALKFDTAKKNGSQNSDKPLNIDEASDYLGIPKSTIYTLTSRQEIPFYKKGRQLFFFKEELKDWLKTGRQCTIAEIKADAMESFNQLNGRV